MLMWPIETISAVSLKNMHHDVRTNTKYVCLSFGQALRMPWVTTCTAEPNVLRHLCCITLDHAPYHFGPPDKSDAPGEGGHVFHGHSQTCTQATFCVLLSPVFRTSDNVTVEVTCTVLYKVDPENVDTYVPCLPLGSDACEAVCEAQKYSDSAAFLSALPLSRL